MPVKYKFVKKREAWCGKKLGKFCNLPVYIEIRSKVARLHGGWHGQGGVLPLQDRYG